MLWDHTRDIERKGVQRSRAIPRSSALACGSAACMLAADDAWVLDSDEGEEAVDKCMSSMCVWKRKVDGRRCYQCLLWFRSSGLGFRVQGLGKVDGRRCYQCLL
jgi:hypothetical protein